MKNKTLLGLWDNFGYGFSKSERELIRRKYRNNRTKICKLCKIEYYRKYDKNNLCDTCNSLSKDELKIIKEYLKERTKNETNKSHD